MLTLGWSDGFSFAPIDFIMLSSAKLANRICESKSIFLSAAMATSVDFEALGRKPDAVVDLLKRALTAGFKADYVLMDSWFTQAPLLRQLNEMGLPVIGMVKELKQRYRLNGKLMTLKEVYANFPKSKATEILGSVIAETACGLPARLVFVQNRNKRREWLAIITTDLTGERGRNRANLCACVGVSRHFSNLRRAILNLVPSSRAVLLTC